MSRRSAGVTFCGIAAFLFSVRYISAAIFGAGHTSWSAELFTGLLNYVGSGLLISSVIFVLVGVFYLVLAEIKKED